MISMIKFKCTRCSEVVSGASEYDAEVAFGNHTCTGKRDLSEMPTDILLRVINQEITEAEAWKLGIDDEMVAK